MVILHSVSMQSILRYLDLGSVGLAVLVGLVTLVLLEIFRLSSSRSRNPPGPTPLPFIGNVIQFLWDPWNVTKTVRFCFVFIYLFLAHAL